MFGESNSLSVVPSSVERWNSRSTEMPTLSEVSDFGHLNDSPTLEPVLCNLIVWKRLYSSSRSSVLVSIRLKFKIKLSPFTYLDEVNGISVGSHYLTSELEHPLKKLAKSSCIVFSHLYSFGFRIIRMKIAFIPGTLLTCWVHWLTVFLPFLLFRFGF